MGVDPTVVRDVVVVLPGIMGSELAVGNKVVWALRKRTLISGILRLGRSLDPLVLPEGAGNSDPDDPGDPGDPDEPGSGSARRPRLARVTPVRLVSDLHVIPGLWSPVDGYDALLNFLRSERFHLIEGDIHDPDEARLANLIPFPYDWRLSCRVNGRRLRRAIVPILERWRSQPGFGDARLVIVAHSMGGLVARSFIELEGGAELTRALVTVGTPHQGATNALETLAHGMSAGVGVLSERLTTFARSLPSLHELLPQYKVIDDGRTRAMLSPSAYGLDPRMVDRANAFHQQLRTSAEHTAPTYELHKVVGIRQPTSTTARSNGDGFVVTTEIDARDQGGDGTVPRLSAEPANGRGHNVLTVSERHGSLHNTKAVLDMIDGLLTQDSIIWQGDAAPDGLGVQLPDMWTTAEPPPALQVVAGPDLRLRATIVRDGAQTGIRLPIGGDRRLTLPPLPAGGYRVTVDAAGPGSATITVPVLVWDPAAR
ncbi:MAG: hypothetical protein JWM12_1115 [Ilumatobacteraceae bacterium]|nr:hypothetical protein [Ilumatobacteraceae bacterium]